MDVYFKKNGSNYKIMLIILKTNTIFKFKNVHNCSFIRVIYYYNVHVNKFKLKIDLEINSVRYRWRKFSLVSQIN